MTDPITPTSAHPPAVSDIRHGMTVADLKQSFIDNLACALGRGLKLATRHDHYVALALTVRDRVLDHEVETVRTLAGPHSRMVAYLSAEFLPGPHLMNNLLNLGSVEPMRQALAELGLDLDALAGEEEEPGLGNGGLGRLASCYMDSMASLDVPALGYGIRYEFGIFDQTIKDGWQAEITDKWLRNGNPWEIPRPEVVCEVMFGGHTEKWNDAEGRFRVRWVPRDVVRGVAYDTPILGYRVRTCNTLRLWKAEAVESFDFEAFNHGDYYRAVEDKVASENITKVLYPNDEIAQGKILRLQQQFFFVSCSLQDMIRLHLLLRRPLERFYDTWAVQLNDTHPAIAVAELMRLLVDEHGLPWADAWAVTQKTLAYTNHTLLPEALEKWPVELLGGLLPRHLEIIYEINRRFVEEVRAALPRRRGARGAHVDHRRGRRSGRAHGPPGDGRQPHRQWSRRAALPAAHRDGAAGLLRTVARQVRERHQRRHAPALRGRQQPAARAASSPDAIGDGWLKDLGQLRRLEPLADAAEFRRQWRDVKLAAKRALATLVEERVGVSVDPSALFDVQAKRLHEYKRQHLNVLHILSLYLKLKRDPAADIPARVFLFGAKAAPGYFMAKRIIKLINATAAVVNGDPDVGGRLKVAFFPDFNVTNAQHIYPAADLSEQISTAGKEASGTGNMKFAMNGALTIGTLDGANVEIREEVGAENFFLFGLTAGQVAEVKALGYRPRDYYEGNAELREVLDFIASGALAGGDTELFKPVVDNLLWSDPFLVLADYEAYVKCQAEVSRAWRDSEAWTRMSILNAARMGRFSSDRSIRDYCARVWHVEPAPRPATED